MKEEISKTLAKVQNNAQKTTSQITSTSAPQPLQGKPDCPYCQGIGFVRYDVPVGHPKFGKIEVCVCRVVDVAQNARERLYALSSLGHLGHLTFDNFNTTGNPKAKGKLADIEIRSLMDAKLKCEDFSIRLEGWILLEGTYGSGKTHLAAAIANSAVSRGIPTLFITVPDLLDSLRFAYNSPETTFEERFEEIRGAKLLVMDDFGTHNATGWAQEKLFQIINFRYINKLPTVITTNLILDEIESRIRSRLQDEELVKHIRILSLDYRHPDETSNPGLSMLSMHDIKKMTFNSFVTREDEIGEEIVTTAIIEKSDKYGNLVKEKAVTREKVTAEQIEKLKEITHAAYDFALKPQGWLVILGHAYSGKTHLAAAIGNHRLGVGGQAIMTDLSVLLDYLKVPFDSNADISFNRRFYEIRTAPLLILDGVKESNSNSRWAEDKLYQLLNYRYYENLPTVITSGMEANDFAVNYPSLWNKMLDPTKCQVYTTDIPPFRKQKSKKSASGRKRSN